MIDMQQLIDDLQVSGTLPAEWSVEWALSMEAIEAEDLPSNVPLLTLYQGAEYFSPRDGSPCFQTAMPSLIKAIIVCKKTELKPRVDEARTALVGWQAAGDRDYHALYLSDDPGNPCDSLGVKGDYIWWQDVLMTRYPFIPNS